MKTNIREREPSDEEVELEEPHFDEEETLLSARPVVPLREVEAASRSGKKWAFGLVIVVALLIGAFSAALVYKLRSPAPAVSSADLDDPAQPTSPILAGGVAALESEKPQPSASVEPKNATSTRESAATVAPVSARKSPVVALSTRNQASPRNESLQIDDPDQIELDREAQRAEKRERRRLRRAEKEARQIDGRRSDDLLRIREIFEGVPRP